MVKKDSQNIDPEAVHRLCLEQGRSVAAPQAALLAGYLTLLMEWNKRINLVGSSDWRTVLASLVADSWHLADYLSSLDLVDDPLTLDIGAGGGLPGIPLRMFWDSGRYVMVEVRRKRSAFLAYALSRLDLHRTMSFAGRAEDLPSDLRRADLVLGRAFRPWKEFLELTKSLLRPGGTVIVMANTPAPKEQDLPDGWDLAGEWEYRVAYGVRYFWSLSW